MNEKPRQAFDVGDIIKKVDSQLKFAEKGDTVVNIVCVSA